MRPVWSEFTVVVYKSVIYSIPTMSPPRNASPAPVVSTTSLTGGGATEMTCVYYTYHHKQHHVTSFNSLHVTHSLTQSHSHHSSWQPFLTHTVSPAPRQEPTRYQEGSKVRVRRTFRSGVGDTHWWGPAMRETSSSAAALAGLRMSAIFAHSTTSPTLPSPASFSATSREKLTTDMVKLGS